MKLLLSSNEIRVLIQTSINNHCILHFIICLGIELSSLYLVLLKRKKILELNDTCFLYLFISTYFWRNSIVTLQIFDNKHVYYMNKPS